MSHVPLIHGPDGSKLSKRHGALGVDAYRAMGYLPEALRNYLVRLGWSHGDQEMFSTAGTDRRNSICPPSAVRRRASTSPSSKTSTATICARPTTPTLVAAVRGRPALHPQRRRRWRPSSTTRPARSSSRPCRA